MSCKQIMSTKLFRNQVIISPWNWSSDHTWFESCGDFKNINPNSFRVIQKDVINDGSFHGSPVIKIRYEFIFIISKLFWTKMFGFVYLWFSNTSLSMAATFLFIIIFLNQAWLRFDLILFSWLLLMGGIFILWSSDSMNLTYFSRAVVSIST